MEKKMKYEKPKLIMLDSYNEIAGGTCKDGVGDVLCINGLSAAPPISCISGSVAPGACSLGGTYGMCDKGAAV